MSYTTQALLSLDTDFQRRIRAALVQQADTYRSDTRADIVALAESILKTDGATTITFYDVVAAAPGFAGDVDMGDGTIDQSQVSDLAILAAVQAAWPTVAGLYFDPTGAPI